MPLLLLLAVTFAKPRLGFLINSSSTCPLGVPVGIKCLMKVKLGHRLADARI